jgi:hypothetical protein
LRVFLFFGVVFAASAWWKVRQVKAHFSELSATVGEQLLRLQKVADGTSTLKLNGRRVSLTTVTTQATVNEVLDRFNTTCMNSSGGLLEELREMEAMGAHIPESLPRNSLGVLRMERGEFEATSACFVREGHGGLRELWQRIARFSQTRDLSEFGQLRAVFVRHHETSHVTHVLAFTGLDKFPLEEMFPAEGDAPGSDLLDGVRPAHARRVLSAQLEDTRHETTLYEADGDPDSALDSYHEPLRSRGFVPGDMTKVADMNPVPTRVYFKRDDAVVVLASPQEDEHKSLVAAFRLANGGFVSMRE